MKEHVQKTGIRQWAGEDFIDLQSEPLKAIEGFFKEYGSCIIQGGHVTSNGNGTFSVSSGLAALSGKDVEGNDTFKVVPFAALEKTTLPVYLTLTCSIVERAYMDNKVKPIAYEYKAAVAAVKPEGVSYLELSEKVLRFVDVMQDTAHRFMTDTERTKLNGIAEGANNYVHPGSHPASMITEDAIHRFMTDAERTKLNGIAEGANNYVHPGSHPASMITEDAIHRFMTDAERTKLNGIAAGANNYVHPGSHPASMIEESSSRKFMTDTEKNLLSTLGTNAALKDFSNVSTKSLSQNGYYKLPDGLMIQWGKKTNTSYSGTIYFPSSFYDTNYSLHLTCNNGNTGNDSSWIANYSSVSSSSFGYNNKYQQAANAGTNTASFYWFAVGRWK